MLTCQIELDDQVFFASIELLNKSDAKFCLKFNEQFVFYFRFLICSMIKTCQQSNDLRIVKEKCLREKYLITIACFRLATQICVRLFSKNRVHHEKNRCLGSID